VTGLIVPETLEPAASVEPDASAPNILLVDGDAINLNVLAQTLSSEGYAITRATSAEQALHELFRERYDLVIADVMMPNMSGYELTRILREQFDLTELPVLLLTARIRMEDIVTGFQAGANDYLKKPADAWELKARVRSLIQLKTYFEERLRMESAWLQSQIQPHFLYNTLNSIAALGVIDLEKMQTMLHEFSNYLRLSFDFKNTSPLVDLEHELSLVRSYLYIEQMRFEDRIKVEMDVEEGSASGCLRCLSSRWWKMPSNTVSRAGTAAEP
jgi:sensor histidine kinase YesM